jgi:CBS domain-containing protein
MNANLSLLKQWREQMITSVANDYEKLNIFHDELMKKAINIAIEKVKSEQGEPPVHFAFFLMGSSGRGEQSVWSDQDHGIIFDGPNECNPYFLTLGKEISTVLKVVGYAYCDGKVMASNPLWCKSKTEWEKQINEWLNEQSWESIRYFSTFFDSRVLTGKNHLLVELKEFSFLEVEKDPHLYHRFIENVSHIKKGIGLFGQLLSSSHGQEAGSINIKEKVFFPYVNSLRIIAMKEHLTVPSTLSRFHHLPNSYHHIKGYKNDFIKLLNYRLHFQRDSKSYEKVHLLKVDRLTKNEKQELKRIMKNGYRLFSETRAIIEKGVQYGNQ